MFNERVLGCGGRDYSDRARVEEVLKVIQPLTLIHGGATGADSWVGEFGEKYQIPVAVYSALWWEDGIYNPEAGFNRNAQMLEVAKPTLVVAFPGGNGTAHMVCLAREAGVLVVEVSAEGEVYYAPGVRCGRRQMRCGSNALYSWGLTVGTIYEVIREPGLWEGLVKVVDNQGYACYFSESLFTDVYC